MKRQALPTISCDDKPCGLCCEGMGSLPADYYRCKTDKPPQHVGALGGLALLPEELQAELLAVEIWTDDPAAAPLEYVKRVVEDKEGPCMWLDQETRKCKHYEHRPDVCRDAVKPGDQACRKARRAAGLTPQPVTPSRGESW